MINPRVQVRDVVKTYVLGHGEVHALRGVSCELNKGEFVALCGPSGSGKTTLLNLLGGLDVPSSGEIIIGSNRVSHLSDGQLAEFRAHQLGFIFQTFNLLPVLSALENVEYPLLRQPFSGRERKEKAREALARVGLEKFADHRPDQLSGGQRQRVAIARAFVHGPELIIADEPTANLDKKTAGEILDLLSQLNENLGLTIVVATHDPLVMARAGRTLIISDGLLLAPAAEEVFEQKVFPLVSVKAARAA